MSSSTIIQIRGKGSLTLPVALRRKYRLNEGDVYTLVDLGDGSFLLTPRLSQVERLGDQIARTMKEENVTLDELLSALDEERESYYRERYAKS